MSDVDMGDSSNSVENRLKDLEGDEEEDEVETQPRKRSHSSDSEGDRDGDESDAPPKKKKHRPGAQFVDDIAINEDDEDEPDDESEEDEYDDDEEEEDLGDGEVDDGEDVTDDRGSGKRDKKKNKKERHRAMMDFSGEDETMHMTLDNQRDKEEMAAMAKSIEDRYKDAHYDDDYDEDGANRSSSGAVLPSVRDPSLFLLRIGKGEREEDVLYQLLHQYYKRELDPDPSRRLHITSAFTTPASRGYIYVEAFREVHVEQAIKALPKQRMVSYYANSKKNIKVPITEMVAAIKFHSEQQSVQPKQWVRFKRGPNKDDLAQVVNVQDQGTIITLKFVPRIDFLYLEAKRKNDKLTRQQYKLQTASSGPLRRPIQKYFDERELRNLGFPVEKKRGTGLDKHTTYYHFMNGKYKNGFQFKDVKIDALETEHVNPSLAELERFTTRSGMDSDEDLDEAELEVQRKAEEDAIAMATAMSAGSKRQVVYSTGDRVQIIAGALRNVTGRVLSIGKDRLTIQADIANIPMPIEEVLSHVRKYFSIGAHVKVVSGVYKNETGMICHVPEDAGLDDKIAIHTDISARTIEVSSQDVVESSEVSTGRDTFGNYELHELVQLTNDVVGVIIRVHMASFYVLTNTGAVQQVKLQEIQNKRNDRFSHTPDKNGEAINRDDKVFILAGPERGKKASVKHIFKRTLFVHSNEVADNGGLFVIRGDQVALVGGKHTMRQHQQPMAAPRSPGGGARSPGPAPQSPRAASGFAGGQGRGFKKDPIIGKDVKITGGPYKGYAGVCLDVLEGGQARVEIRAMFRKISVPRNQIMEVEIVTSRVASNPFYGSQTPLVGGATPAHTGFGSATPGHDFGGSMTPSHLGSRTPSHADHDVWSAQTPAHRSDERQRIDEEEEEQEEWRVGLGLDSNNTMATPSAGSSASHLQPQTPGAVPPTPLVPPTPSADYAPQTPSTPYDEQAQQAAADEDEDIDHPPVAGIFAHPSLIGCQVTLRGGPATGTIVDIQAGGASVKVRPHAGGRVGTYTQTDLQPIQPGNNESAIFIQPHKTYAQYSRCSVLSTLLNEAVIDSGELVPLDVLCKIDSQDDDGEGQGEEKTKKKKGEKKK